VYHIISTRDGAIDSAIIIDMCCDRHWSHEMDRRFSSSGRPTVALLLYFTDCCSCPVLRTTLTSAAWYIPTDPSLTTIS